MDGQRRFEWSTENGRRVLIQRSIIDPKLWWRVSLVKTSVDPQYQGVMEPSGKPVFNPKAARAKLMGKSGADDGLYRFGLGVPKAERAHGDDDMACFTCHLSWTTSCAGCHLPIEANWKSATHKYEEDYTRNYATYNPRLRAMTCSSWAEHMPTKSSGSDPVKFDAAGDPVSGKAITAPNSLDLGLDPLLHQHQPRADLRTAAADLLARLFLAGLRAALPAIGAHVAATEQCTDCHLSQADDNNAVMAQAAAARCRLRQLRRHERVVRAGRRVRGRARDRMGRAAGGDRQLSPALCLPRFLQATCREERPRARGIRRAEACSPGILAGRPRAAKNS